MRSISEAKHLKKIAILVVLFSVVMAGSFVPVSVRSKVNDLETEQLFKRGTEAYRQQNYALSLKYFEQIPLRNDLWEVCYNIGCCYLALENFPRAILWLRRARNLNSGNDSINRNLEIARERLEHSPPQLSGFAGFLTGIFDSVSFAGLTWSIHFLLFISSILLALNFNFRLKIIRRTAIVFLSAVVLISGLYLIKYEFFNPAGAVTTVSTAVRTGPSADFELIAEINPGSEINIIRAEGNYFLINYRELNGYVNISAIELI